MVYDPIGFLFFLVTIHAKEFCYQKHKIADREQNSEDCLDSKGPSHVCQAILMEQIIGCRSTTSSYHDKCHFVP